MIYLPARRPIRLPVSLLVAPLLGLLSPALPAADTDTDRVRRANALLAAEKGGEARACLAADTPPPADHTTGDRALRVLLEGTFALPDFGDGSSAVASRAMAPLFEAYDQVRKIAAADDSAVAHQTAGDMAAALVTVLAERTETFPAGDALRPVRRDRAAD